MEAQSLSQMNSEGIETPCHLLEDFTQCLTPAGGLSIALYIELKQTPVFESKKHFKQIEDKISAEKNSIVSKIKMLKKRADELKRKSNTISMEEKVSSIINLSSTYENFISTSSKEPVASFFHEDYADEINMLKQTLGDHIECDLISGSSILDNARAKDMLKLSLYRVYHSYLINTPQMVMSLIFSEILKKSIDLRLLNHFSSERIISEIFIKLISLLVKIQLERSYNELRALERLSQNLVHQKQLRGLPLYLTEWFFKLNDRVDLSVYPFKNIFIFLFLLLTLGLQLIDQYPKYKNSRAFLKFLQHDPGAIYIIMVRSQGRKFPCTFDSLQLL